MSTHPFVQPWGPPADKVDRSKRRAFYKRQRQDTNVECAKRCSEGLGPTTPALRGGLRGAALALRDRLVQDQEKREGGHRPHQSTVIRRSRPAARPGLVRPKNCSGHVLSEHASAIPGRGDTSLDPERSEIVALRAGRVHDQPILLLLLYSRYRS